MVTRTFLALYNVCIDRTIRGTKQRHKIRVWLLGVSFIDFHLQRLFKNTVFTDLRILFCKKINKDESPMCSCHFLWKSQCLYFTKCTEMQRREHKNGCFGLFLVKCSTKRNKIFLSTYEHNKDVW